jgi:flagellar basal-body rod protein FlgG
MPDGAAIAIASMANDSESLRIISQNMANATTPGYKRIFSVPANYESLHSTLQNLHLMPATSSLLPEHVQLIDPKAATLRPSANPLDLAIEGDGFFELRGPSGIYYTRQGNFALDANGLLIGANGDAVSGVAGDLHLDGTQVRIDRQGRIYDRKDVLLGQLKLVRFDKPSQLRPAGNGRYLPGSAQVLGGIEGTSVRQGYIEASNVSTASEMLRLIESMRHFQSGQQVVQAYDQMLETAMNKLGEY